MKHIMYGILQNIHKNKLKQEDEKKTVSIVEKY